MERIPQSIIVSPEEELALLRQAVLEKERELLSQNEKVSREAIIGERIVHHQGVDTGVAEPLSHEARETVVVNLPPDNNDETMRELTRIVETKGLKNALSVAEHIGPHIADDFHRFLVQYIAKGMPVSGLKEGSRTWQALHMTLYEVALPDVSEKETSHALREVVSKMEQFYAGMLGTAFSQHKEAPRFVMELGVSVDEPQVIFYVSVPNGKRDLFEKQLLSVFPEAQFRPLGEDYNMFVEGGFVSLSTARLKEHPSFSLKTYDTFDYDPLHNLISAFGKIAHHGEGASFQIVIEPSGDRYLNHYKKILRAFEKGEKRDRALGTPEGIRGDLFRAFKDIFSSQSKSSEQGERDQQAIDALQKKITTPIVHTTVRLVTSAGTKDRADALRNELEASFNQYEDTLGNQLIWQEAKRTALTKAIHGFTFREGDRVGIPLSLREVTTLFHFPPEGITSAPQLKQSRATRASAPLDIPQTGTLLGENDYRGVRTKVFLTKEDRLRHLYVIGQTGTGKTTFLKNLIMQDIEEGNGVCFIDPHGNDIIDVLAGIPKERYEDVIYFDPAYLDRPYGLNLLEYDESHPEQKTFIVNELLAIFRRLYGDVPESMGPAFEQYFRNAALLVMEDPESGSTLLDISRVLSDEAFRREKLTKSHNPVVNQFWNDIAGKAGGDAALENIVPYITNKFDDFIANDFVRPIIGQQKSSFNFREIIDGKKILLVNLSKGRLGERNANLLGLILVGKLFMAALSRADSPGAEFPPFYLYIDEFQNVTTDSIPSILSEARKYKLSLSVAHQFLAQLEARTREAVFGNIGSMAVFRVGPEDAKVFAEQFAPVFSASDFMNIENYHAYIRLLARGTPQKPFTLEVMSPGATNPNQVDDLKQLSYLTYGREREGVEMHIQKQYLKQ